MRHTRYYVALAFTVSFALPAGWAFAHSYDNKATGHPEKIIDGPTTVSPGNENGVAGYWVEYTKFTYQDISEDYYNVEMSLEDLEKAYCKEPKGCGNNDTTSINCTIHAPGSHVSQDQLYSGSVSPHAQGLRYPQDKQEFASFLSAATGNYNNGQGGNLAQANAGAGTRLAQIQDQKAFDAAAARMYAYQFAA
ncbi:MAG: hypothetical protein FJZ00_09330, partial [Candidatus Sericytochromatia bacterium]|nr:hypothetical protein [Candidatus Tanganyikabacteria bacterium]